jgi:N-acetylmuramoyl-L-alanine amidase
VTLRTATRAAAGVIAVTVLVCPAAAATAAQGSPVAGKTIVVDPGHQLGNSNPKFRAQLAQTIFNGAIRKSCNTTGTATNAGYPESTFTWEVGKHLRDLLIQAGADVIMTRDSNSRNAWGPCVWDRAYIANDANADAMVSIHGDGAPGSSHGFFALAPVQIPGWTKNDVPADRALAKSMVSGMTAAGATPSSTFPGAIMNSRDTTSLNLSSRPTVTIEMGNMRNAAEARMMSSAAGQQEYARWLFAGLEEYFRAH